MKTITIRFYSEGYQYKDSQEFKGTIEQAQEEAAKQLRNSERYSNKMLKDSFWATFSINGNEDHTKRIKLKGGKIIKNYLK